MALPYYSAVFTYQEYRDGVAQRGRRSRLGPSVNLLLTPAHTKEINTWYRKPNHTQHNCI